VRHGTRSAKLAVPRKGGSPGRYMGAEQAEAFGRRNAVPTELLVRVTPTKVVAQTGISD
jgi:hypothetical protein